MSAEACDALLPTHAYRHPEILKCVSPQQTLWLAQSAGGLTVFSYFPESALTMLLTHSAIAQFWQAFSTQDTPATDLLKRVSHLNVRGSLITLRFLSVLQFRQPIGSCDHAHRRFMTSGL